jgi:kynureninase
VSDRLARFRTLFHPPPGVIYLDGNSLGPLCEPAERALRAAVESWRDRAILGWTAGEVPWFEISRAVAAKLAPLLRAEPGRVAVGQSTTVNLHQLLASFYRPDRRPKIVIDAFAFPTDRYAVVSHLSLRGRSEADLVVVPAEADRTLSEDRLLAAMTLDVGFAVLPAVVYTTGQLLDLPRVTAEARVKGVLVAWDCSHSAGIVPHHFADDGIDLAFGCGYKYLNGGPGAAAWLYISPRHAAVGPGLAGWFGSDPARQFAMADAFAPATDAGRFLMGTPHVFSLAPLLGALGVLLDVGVETLRTHSLALTAHLRGLVGAKLTRFGVRVVTPPEDHRRGGHVTLAHPAAGPLSAALRARHVVPDFRPPDLLRLCPHPLYNTPAECDSAVAVIEDLLATKAYDGAAASVVT